MRKKTLTLLAAAGLALGLSACDDAAVVSENLSTAADNFEIQRRIVFFNGITDTYLLELQGACSIEDEGHQLEVVCKTGEKEYKKHFLGLSDNVSYFVEQLEGEYASAYHYRVTFKPQTILPDIDFRGSVSEGPESQR